MPPPIRSDTIVNAEPAEFSVDDAILTNWVEDSGNYLRLDVVGQNQSANAEATAGWRSGRNRGSRVGARRSKHRRESADIANSRRTP